MKKTFLLTYLPLLLLVSGLVVTASFAQTSAGKGKVPVTDTIPKKEKKIRDLDEALQELDKGEVELQKAFKDFDGDKLEKEIRASLKGLDVDLAKMKQEMAKAMQEVDMVKIKAEVQKALQELDVEKMKVDVQKALQEIDVQKMQRDVQESLSKIDTEKMKLEMEKIKDIDLSKLKEELANIRPQVEKSMQEARKSIDKAKAELTAYKELVDALDADGLLNKKGDYKVEYRDGELTVNGKKLSADATKKYSAWLKDKEPFTISKEDDNFNINK